MAKNKKMPTKENAEIEKSNEVLTEVSKKDLKAKAKAEKTAKTSKQTKTQKKAKVEKQKRSRVKETVSELKKVSWPSFGKACKQTGTVLAVVAVFMLVIFGIDSLLTWIINLIVNI